MRRIIRLVSCVVFGMGAVAARSAADDPRPEEGFTTLFNGRDLTGWQYMKRVGKGRVEIETLDGKTATADGRFEVEDGVIVVHAKDRDGKGGIQDVYTTAEFGTDFVLRLDFRAGPKADSGVYVRGPQLQIRDFPRLGQQKQLTAFKADDWNQLEVAVTGTTAIATCNGQPIDQAMTSLPATGGIGLQAEVGPFEFRRVRIKAKK